MRNFKRDVRFDDLLGHQRPRRVRTPAMTFTVNALLGLLAIALGIGVINVIYYP